MKKRFFGVLAVVVTSLICNAQNSFKSIPQIGKPFTDFVLDSVENYSKKTLSYKDFKGKWIILDFWGEYCNGCINNFPHINALQKKYEKNVQFILVTQIDKRPNTAMVLFRKLKSKFELTMPVSFDQDFVNRVGPNGLPAAVILNPMGIVEAITDALTDTTTLNDFLTGKKPQLARHYLKKEYRPSTAYNSKIPFLVSNNGNPRNEPVNFLYRSVITSGDYDKVRSCTILERNRFEALSFDLATLYRYAYFGKNFWGIGDSLYGNCYLPLIFTLKDSSVFDCDKAIGKNVFSYSLLFSKDMYTDSSFNRSSIADKPKFQKIMQNDLESCFGFKAQIETRKFLYYKLIATPEARQKLKTKGGPEKMQTDIGQHELIGSNLPKALLISYITLSSGFPDQIPVIDEMKIDGNIDINIDAIYFDDWLKELRRNGLDLVPAEKEMKAMVIYDNE